MDAVARNQDSHGTALSFITRPRLTGQDSHGTVSYPRLKAGACPQPRGVRASGQTDRLPTAPKNSIAVANVHRCVDISVCLMSTRRAGKHMTLADAAQSTARASLAGIGWVHLSHDHADFLCLAFNSLADELTLPLRQSPPRSLAAYRTLLWLRDGQSFEDEHRTARRKRHELLRCCLRKGACAIGTLTTQPFEHTPNTARVLVLCLVRRDYLVLPRMASLLSALPLAAQPGSPPGHGAPRRRGQAPCRPARSRA
jgi:hypothetical protein